MVDFEKMEETVRREAVEKISTLSNEQLADGTELKLATDIITRDLKKKIARLTTSQLKDSIARAEQTRLTMVGLMQDGCTDLLVFMREELQRRSDSASM